jgi:hypothetical protein
MEHAADDTKIRYRKRRPPSGDANSDIAIRTRHHKNRAIATVKWDIPRPIILQITSWLDQESLMNTSLVSKQLYNTLCSERGNENKIFPVFVVSGSSVQKLVNNLRKHFLNKKTKVKLQNYSIMKFKEPNRFDDEDVSTEDFKKLKLILKDNSIELNGITSLEFISSSSLLFGRFKSGYLPCILRIILPNLLKLDFSNTTGYTNGIFKELFQCPFLNKVISNDNDDGVDLNGLGMGLSTNLREIHMDNTLFHCGPYFTNYKFADLNNHQKVFIFHGCSRSLECVSMRNMKLPRSTFNDDHHRKIFQQNALVKFVRNAPSLRWFRSDLSADNIDMLQEERSRLGKTKIELLLSDEMISI